MNKNICVFICFLVGVLVFMMIRGYCSCDIEEGYCCKGPCVPNPCNGGTCIPDIENSTYTCKCKCPEGTPSEILGGTCPPGGVKCDTCDSGYNKVGDKCVNCTHTGTFPTGQNNQCGSHITVAGGQSTDPLSEACKNRCCEAMRSHCNTTDGACDWPGINKQECFNTCMSERGCT